MPSRNVAIQQAVYDALSREKRRGESFTKLLRRLMEQKGSLEELFGAWGSGGRRSDRQTLVAIRGAERRR